MEEAPRSVRVLLKRGWEQTFPNAVYQVDFRTGRLMVYQLVGQERGIGFRSICDGMIDTTTASGELVFNIFSALAQFERRLIQERTRAGLCAARARGRKGGRKPIDSEEPRVQMAKAMHKDKSVSITDICQTLNISRATFYRYLALEEGKNSKNNHTTQRHSR